MNAPAPPPSLWQFATEFYAKPRVADACLALQEALDLDVCVLLYALHAARCGRALTEADVAAADAEAQAWREHVVRPLRAVRSWIKTSAEREAWTGAESVRELVKRSELEGERVLLQALEAFDGRRHVTPGSAGPPGWLVARFYAQGDTARLESERVRAALAVVSS